MSEEKQPRKASSVRHTRAIQRDHTKHSITAPSSEEIQERLTEIVHPATLAQTDYFRSLGLRERTLSLVVMVAFVLEMIWRQIGGVSELVRLIQTESILWTTPRKVSQQAFSQRLISLPSDLFLKILLSILPLMQKRWAERKRPYLSNELDAERLPVTYLVALYWQRWRIEDAYAIVKRLLGLAYFWCGAQNAVEIQVWATWLLYAVLVDLTDSVADALNQPFAAISIEMVYRSLYFFTQAHQRNQAEDVVAYLAANSKLLGIVKRKRKAKQFPALTVPVLP